MGSHFISKGVERSNYAGQRLERGCWKPRSIMLRMGKAVEARAGRRRKHRRKECEEPRNRAAVGLETVRSI